jgi:hypothetical protein
VLQSQPERARDAGARHEHGRRPGPEELDATSAGASTGLLAPLTVPDITKLDISRT